MKLRVLLGVGLALSLGCARVGLAQQRGNWRASSKTAQSVTGDLAFGDERLAINFMSYPIAEIRPLRATEVLAVFDGADATAASAHLYRISVPGAQRFLHKNTLCGGDDVQWMAMLVVRKSLMIAMFSTATPPVLTVEAMNGATNFCGSYSYVR